MKLKNFSLTRNNPQTVLVLTNIYKDMGAIMSQFMTKISLRAVVCSIAHNFDGFAYNKANSVRKLVSMIKKYHNHKPQTTPWHSEEEPHNRHETPGRQIKQSNQLSLPHQDDCNTRMDIK